MFRFWKRRKPAGDAGGDKEQPNQASLADQTGRLNAYPTKRDYEVVGSLRTDVGCIREVNEDYGELTHPGDSELLEKKGVLVVVCDGMGGHAAGEVASHLAVETIRRAYYSDPGDPQSSLKKAVLEANQRIYEVALNDERMKGMGTTCTALVLQNGSAVSAHVGDSRVYLIRGDQIYLMTEDHSAVMEMVKRGLISLTVARHHPDKNVILRALGSQPEVEVTTWDHPFPVRVGDSFLICSDGLYDLVEDEEIKQAVLSADPHAACENLIALAKQRGGHDNITVGIVHLRAAGESKDREVRDTRDLEVAKG
jgi:protein phosphatase